MFVVYLIMGIIVFPLGCFMLFVLISGKDKGNPFTCRMGWHKAPKEQGFDGCSSNGKCPKCGAFVMQDSQGNWFGNCPEK